MLLKWCWQCGGIRIIISPREFLVCSAPHRDCAPDPAEELHSRFSLGASIAYSACIQKNRVVIVFQHDSRLSAMWNQHKVIITLALIVGSAYGGHMLYRYMKIREELRQARIPGCPAYTRGT